MGSWLPFRMVRKSRKLCCHMYENEQFRKKRWSMISLRIVLAQKNIPWTIIIRFSCYFSANNMVITIWIDNFGIIMDFHVIQKEDSNIFQQWTPTTIIPCIFTILWIICGLDYHYHVFFLKKNTVLDITLRYHTANHYSLLQQVQLTLLSRGFYAYFQSPCLAWYPQYLDVHSS